MLQKNAEWQKSTVSNALTDKKYVSPDLKKENHGRL